ncbi:MAG: phosphatidylinositol transfer protein [Polyangiaceae bacterium]|nr:phosphatidylinositol transfer protein [Polyangiaceae bacterium]
MRLLLAPLLLILAACGSSGSTEEPGFSEGGAAGSGGTSGGGGVSGAGAGGSAGRVSCTPLPACDAAPPDPGPKRDWNKTTSSVTALGSPTHRGRDLFLTPGQDQWIIGKFAYFVGVNDKDISEEEVDIYLLRNCQGPWEKLATVKTTDDGDHPTIEGVEDSGGRVYYKIPAEKALGPGLHRVHMVVAGDLSTTDLYLDIVEPGTPIFVSDVDGTLTTSENVEFVKLLQGTLPDAHVDAGKALSLLASKGYHPMYMTARPEFLTQRTREFVKARGLPFGLVHTTLGLTGALGGSAVEYKTGELKMLADRGLVPSWAFGNKESDAEAYNNGNLQPLNQRIFYQFDDTLFGGRKINEYTDLLAEFTALPDVCK